MTSNASVRDKVLSKRKRVQCVDCKDQGLIVIDHTEGNQICVNCGRVAEVVLISDQQEWRSFNTESSGGTTNDRSRVGEVNDVWLEGANSTTFIGGSRRMQQIQNLVGNYESSDKQLKTSFTLLRHIGDALNINEMVLERCKEMLKELNDSNQLKGRTNTVNVLALVYLGCREVGVSRTLKELAIYDSKVSQKELGRAINRTKRLLPNRGNAVVEDTAQLIPRFCSLLRLSNKIASLCEYVAGKAVMVLRTSHRTTSLAAGVIYFIVHLVSAADPSVNVPSVVDISRVCGTSESTIKAAVKELNSVKNVVLPPNFNHDNPTASIF